jgi:hypothetical protein
MRTTTTLTDLAPIFDEFRASGLTRLADFAKALNECGIRTPNGKGQWHAADVLRVYMAILVDRTRAKRGRFRDFLAG